MLRNISTTSLGTVCDLPVECKVFYRYERRFKCIYALRLNHSCVTFNYFTCPAINHSISSKKISSIVEWKTWLSEYKIEYYTILYILK